MSQLNKLLKHSLSDKEISDFFMGKINILRYSELSNYNSLDEVLGKYRRAIILFENEHNFNHWVALVEIRIPKKKPYILFADSYGVIPNDEFNFIPKSFAKMSNQDRNVLLDLLIDQPLQVHYNNYRLQHLGKLHGVSVNTCGRWASAFCYYNMVPEEEFAKLFRSGQSYGISPDELVSLWFEELKNNPNRLNLV